jgi:hypothetical protein
MFDLILADRKRRQNLLRTTIPLLVSNDGQANESAPHRRAPSTPGSSCHCSRQNDHGGGRFRSATRRRVGLIAAKYRARLLEKWGSIVKVASSSPRAQFHGSQTTRSVDNFRIIFELLCRSNAGRDLRDKGRDPQAREFVAAHGPLQGPEKICGALHEQPHESLPRFRRDKLPPRHESKSGRLGPTAPLAR